MEPASITLLFLLAIIAGGEALAYIKRMRNAWRPLSGARARDAVLRFMEDEGMPTCAGPAFKDGPLVVVGLGFEDKRYYVIDTTSYETVARDATAVVQAERDGKKGS